MQRNGVTIEDMGQALEKLKRYLEQVVSNGRFDLQYVITPGGAAPVQPPPGTPTSVQSGVPAGSSDAPDRSAAPETSAAAGSSASAVSADASGTGTTPDFAVDFSGPDVALLTARNGELLHAIESVAAEILGLEAGEHHRLAFDAEGYRAARARSLEQAVEQACDGVLRSGRLHAFPPMNSRERRLIHLTAARLGIQTASTGEGPRRSVVLYPAGQAPPAEPSFHSASGVTLPGERRSRPGSPGGDRRNNGGNDRGSRSAFGADDRGNRFASARAAQPYDPQQTATGDEPADNQPSAEDRARAIRERFRKR